MATGVGAAIATWAGMTTPTLVAGVGTAGLTAAGMFAAAAINTALIVAISTIAGRLLAPSGPSSATSSGYKDTIRDSILPRRIVYGRRVLSGPITFIETGGNDTHELHMIIALTTHPVEDITHAIINDDIIRISGSPDNPGPEGNDLIGSGDGNTNGGQYNLNENRAGMAEEVKKRWAVDFWANGDIWYNPINIIKVNGWAAASDRYIPDHNNGTLNSQDWYVDDIKAHKRISQFIKYTGDGVTSNKNGYPTAETDLDSPQLSGSGITDPDERWTIDHKLTDCSFAYIRLRYRAEHPWQASLPQIRFLVKGKRVYDPTDDDLTEHYNTGLDTSSGRIDPKIRGWGGTATLPYTPSSGIDGTQRFSLPGTWKWSDNWALIISDYMRDTFYGMRMKHHAPLSSIQTEVSLYAGSGWYDEPLNEIDWYTLEEAIRDSGAAITTGETGASPGEDIPRYTLNGILETSQEPIGNFEAMLLEGAGHAIYTQGQWKLYAGVYKKPNSADDIIDETWLADGGLKVKTSVSMSELFNKGAGVYIKAVTQHDEYDNYAGLNGYPMYEPHDFPLVDPLDSGGVNPYEIEDGEERIKQFDYPFTTNEWEAQRLTRIALERSRNSITVAGSFKIDIFKYNVGDRVYITNDMLGWDMVVQDDPEDTNYSGDGPKCFKITSMNLNSDLTVDVSFLEESSYVYDWNEGYALPDDYIPGTSLEPGQLSKLPRLPIWDLTLTADDAIDGFIRVNNDGEAEIVTSIQWEESAVAGQFNATRHYILEYGKVTDSDATNAASRVASWIPVAPVPFNTNNEIPTSPGTGGDRLLQGGLEITGLDNRSSSSDPDNNGVVRYEFRVKAVSTTGTESAWVYYMDSTEGAGDGLGYVIYYDSTRPPTPTAITFDVFPDRGYVDVIVWNDNNNHKDNSHVLLWMSKTPTSHLGVGSDAFLIDVPPDFSRLSNYSKRVIIRVTLPDYDTWYFWAGMYDTSNNGPLQDDHWYPAFGTTGESTALTRDYTYYIKSIYGNAIETSADSLEVQATRVAAGIEPEVLTSGNIQLYLKDSGGALYTPESAAEYIWSNIDYNDINNSLVVYLADDSVSPPVEYDTITLVDITDSVDGEDALIGYQYWAAGGQLVFVEEKDGGGWRNGVNIDVPSWAFVRSGTIQTTTYLDLTATSSSNIKVDNSVYDIVTWPNPGGGDHLVKVNGITVWDSTGSPTDLFPYNAGEEATIEMIYTMPDGASFTVVETWYIISEGNTGPTGPPGDKVIGVLLNKDGIASPNNGYLYVHGYDSSGNPSSDDAEIVIDGTSVTVSSGSIETTILAPGSDESGDSPDLGEVGETWLIYETDELISPPPFSHSGSQNFMAMARKSRYGWYYDNGADSWDSISVTDTMYVIGTVSTKSGPHAIDQATIIPPMALASIPVERAHEVDDGDINDGAISAHDQFVQGLRAVTIWSTSTLPSQGSPSSLYPEGSYLVWTENGRLYKRNSEDEWVFAVVDTTKSLTPDLTFSEGHIGRGVSIDSDGTYHDDTNYNWYEYDATIVDEDLQVVTATDAAIGTTVIENKSGGEALVVCKHYIPIDPAKTYRASCTYRTETTGTGVFYAGIIFLDDEYKYIAPAGEDHWNGVDLGGIGTYHYFVTAVTPTLTTWTTTDKQFGGSYSSSDPDNTVGEIPSTARYVQVVALFNYIGGSPVGTSIHQVNELRVDEVMPGSMLEADSVTAGTIEAGAVVAEHLEAQMALLSNIRTATSGYRVEIRGGDSMPIYMGNEGVPTYAGAKFAIDTSGNAKFGGDISAASGTFTGDLSGSAITAASINTSSFLISDGYTGSSFLKNTDYSDRAIHPSRMYSLGTSTSFTSMTTGTYYPLGTNGPGIGMWHPDYTAGSRTLARANQDFNVFWSASSQTDQANSSLYIVYYLDYCLWTAGGGYSDGWSNLVARTTMNNGSYTKGSGSTIAEWVNVEADEFGTWDAYMFRIRVYRGTSSSGSARVLPGANITTFTGQWSTAGVGPIMS